MKYTKEWLKKALSICSEGGPVPVLALCGNSGCCKSIAVELICKELQIEIVVWNENVNNAFNVSSREQTNNYTNNRDLFKLYDSSSRFNFKKVSFYFIVQHNASKL